MVSQDYIPRAIEKYAFDESLTGRHMVFLAGPRQVGKTMLARQWLEKNGCPSPISGKHLDREYRKVLVAPGLDPLTPLTGVQSRISYLLPCIPPNLHTKQAN